MNFHQMVLGLIEEVQEKIEAEKNSRIAMENRIEKMERRSLVTVGLSVLVIFLTVLAFSKDFFVEESKLIEIVSVNFKFDLKDTWSTSILQKMTTVHSRDRERFSAWGVTWELEEILEKASAQETLTFKIRPLSSLSAEEGLYEIKVVINGKDGSPLITLEDFVSYPVSSPPPESDKANEENSSAPTPSENDGIFYRTVDLIALREQHNIRDSIALTLQVGRINEYSE